MQTSIEIAAAALALTAAAFAQEEPAEDIASVPCEERHAGDDEHKTYLLIGREAEAEAPKGGYKLLLILPGGDGGRGFEAFCKRIHEHALGDGWLAAQLVAKKWTDEQRIVWPTEDNEVDKMEFTTEEFIAAVLEDIEAEIELDRDYLFTLSWSSSGPACYAAALQKQSRITGSFIAMSVFKPDLLPSLRNAKGRAFYLLHSKDDAVCPMRMAEEAERQLQKQKAEVVLATYEGGHGWHGPVWTQMQTGIAWLEEHHAKAARHPKPKRARR